LNMDTKDRKNYLAWVFLLVVIAVFCFLRLSHSDLNRPMEWDELITLQYFTWCGVQSDGEPQWLDRIEDFHGLEKPSLRQLGIGIYCSLGRWPGPQNHMVNSLLANFSLGAFQPNEASLRLPALVGALAFGVTLFWLCYQVLGWRIAAPIVFLLGLWSPFVWRYSLEARGYTWMLTLQVLLLIVLFRLAGRPRSIVWGAVAGLVAALNFMNLLTMALYWVLPVYCSLWVLCPGSAGRASGLDGEKKEKWRRNLLIQGLALGGLGSLFLMDRLPYAYAAARATGFEIRGRRGLVDLLEEMDAVLFPGVGWKLVVVVGLLGLFFSPRRSTQRTISIVGLSSLGLALFHGALSGRTPAARILSLALPIVLLGAAGLLEIVVAKLGTRRLAVGVRVAALTGALLLATSTTGRGLEDRRFTQLCQELANMPSAVESETVVLRERSVGISAALYYPPQWRELRLGLVGSGSTEVLFILRNKAGPRWSLIMRGGPGRQVFSWDPLLWPSRNLLEIEDRYRVEKVRGKTVPFPGPDLVEKALVFWFPAFESVAVSPYKVQRHLEGYRLRYLPLQAPFQAKLDIFVRLTCAVLPADSPSDLEEIRRAVSAGLDEFGGEAYVFVPHALE